MAVVGTDLGLTHRRLVEEEVDVEIDPDMKGEVVVEFRTVAAEGEPIVAERC